MNENENFNLQSRNCREKICGRGFEKKNPLYEDHLQVSRSLYSCTNFSANGDFRSFLIPYGVFGSHAGIQDTAGRPDPFPCLLFHAQLTTTIRHTLSYTRGRGLTCIYTGREEVPEGGGGKRRSSYRYHRYNRRRSAPKETERAKLVGAFPSPCTPDTCTRQMMFDVLYVYWQMHVTRFLMNGNGRDPHTATVLEKFASELSRFCRHMQRIHVSIFDIAA